MANAKRQRQDESRSLKRQAEELAFKKSAQKRRIQRIALVAGAALLVVALLVFFTRGNNDSGDSLDAPPGSTTTPVNGAPSITASPQLTAKPVVVVPATPAPTKLDVKDLVMGTGETVKVGDTVEVQYTGVIYATKKQFDSSWDRNTPIPVANIGTDQAPVIKGWSQGLVGAKVGSRRQLIIPPDLGYGTEGNAGAGIKGTDTLLFVVDIISTKRSGTAVTTQGAVRTPSTQGAKSPVVGTTTAAP